MTTKKGRQLFLGNKGTQEKILATAPHLLAKFEGQLRDGRERKKREGGKREGRNRTEGGGARNNP